ncbi:hypothetical protein HHI36_022900 [Cryptolaemus montrouzieri]|uniref:Uncharacterized protein n=1 Tax=Cryptolaemus montrouzieri TaxID=559131 RepID=A0ABD2PER9_9CUCU
MPNPTLIGYNCYVHGLVAQFASQQGLLSERHPGVECRKDLYKISNFWYLAVRTMERFVFVNSVVLLLLTVVGSVVCLEEYDLHKTNDKKNYPPFYPWLGSKHRQKREGTDDEYVKYPELDRQQLSSWLLAMNDASRRYPNRINRESNDNEMSFASDRWMDIDLASRSPPFAPRLGRRNMSPFIPRLGRDIDRFAFV